MTRPFLKMPPATAPNSLSSTPFSIFAICLAFLGLGLCWRLAPYPPGVGHHLGEIVLGLGYMLTGGAIVCQLMRLRRYPIAVMNELRDPVRGPIVLQPVIALQLIAEAELSSRPILAETLVICTTGLALVSSFGLLAIWCRRPGYVQLGTPTWLVPGISIGVASLLTGLLSWETMSETLLVLTILWFAGHALGAAFVIQNRSIPDHVRPLLLIFHAPLPIIYLAWTQTQDTTTTTTGLLLNATILASGFLCLWAVLKLRAPFGYPWWAAGMPPMVPVLAMFAADTVTENQGPMPLIGLIGFVGVHLAFVCLLVPTVKAALRGQMLPLVTPPTRS